MLDFELAQFYNLTVIVMDGGLLETKCAVMIEVEDSNDNMPYWEQEFYHFYTSPNGNDSFIGRVLAQDLDSALYGELKYKLKQKWLPFKVISSIEILRDFLSCKNCFSMYPSIFNPYLTQMICMIRPVLI